MSFQVKDLEKGMSTRDFGSSRRLAMSVMCFFDARQTE